MAAKPALRSVQGPGPKQDFSGPATYADMIVADVRDAVFARRTVPGDFLGSEKDVAARFGVSRNTARDALRTLEALGIVDIRAGAGGGARIASGSPDKFAEALAIQFNLAGVSEVEILDAQWAIEGMAAELAAAHATEYDLQHLGELLVEAKRLEDDPAAFADSSMRFHMAIAEASHNRALVAQLIAIRHVVWPSGGASETKTRAGKILDCHHRLYELIAARDGAGARELMHDHLSSIRAFRSEKSKGKVKEINRA